MISLLAKKLIKNYKDVKNQEVRRSYGVLCGIVGIALNLLLFTGKLIAGMISGSIAIMADALNNLSDAGSSVITLIGFRLSGLKPDPEHPFGHGRIEYISGLLVSLAILLMGFELGKSSIKKIVKPSEVDFSIFTVIILVVSILVKFYMMYYNRSIGKKIDSVAIKATAMDSLSDTLATSVVLVATLIAYFTGLQIDGICGVLLAVFILYSGFGAMKSTIGPLLGQPPEREFVEKIEQLVLSHSEIVGIHDLIVHNYGPGRIMISLHAEVPADDDVITLHDVVDNVEHELRNTLGCMVVIHMDPIVTDDAVTNEMKHKIKEIVRELDESLSIHDFRMVSGPTHTNVIFDIVVPYRYKMTDEAIKAELSHRIQAIDEHCLAVIEVDKEYNKMTLDLRK